jgi:hypothetical protein
MDNSIIYIQAILPDLCRLLLRCVLDVNLRTVITAKLPSVTTVFRFPCIHSSLLSIKLTSLSPSFISFSLSLPFFELFISRKLILVQTDCKMFSLSLSFSLPLSLSLYLSLLQSFLHTYTVRLQCNAIPPLSELFILRLSILPNYKWIIFQIVDSFDGLNPNSRSSSDSSNDDSRRYKPASGPAFAPPAEIQGWRKWRKLKWWFVANT